ncbi:MAG TPA: hypothetical protein ACFYD2_00790 [Candidatus Avalokitesvara rifleensis]|uniref:hypothetical protein n=1 Tax=Candidatus Avalokitesvara rifleensis TaxID=3367620 RepID=UPI0027133532|nr:hypothetical protein [Candidatus Brocadiales bacterium]
MPATTFEAFKDELAALRDRVSAHPKKTLQDEVLQDRFRTLFRTWTTTVSPTVKPLLQSKRNFLKLEAELEALAQLTSKRKPITDYKKRLNRAIQLSDGLVLYLPPSGTTILTSNVSTDLFLSLIPDLPSALVPNALLGWRSSMEAFAHKYSFDKSVFIIVRYKKRNENLVKEIKSILSENGYHGILASEHNLTDDLYNPIACLLCCSKGIAVFDKAGAEEKFNPNVTYELGMLHLLGRECLILKHQSLRTLHTDILMKFYFEYKTVKDARVHTQNWIDRA